MLTELTDGALIEAFKAGNNAAYEELISRYQEKAFHLATRITRNQDDAEEVLQDVFVVVFTKVKHFEGRSAFSSWLYRITLNTAFMKLRQRRKHSASTLDEVRLGSQECWAEKRSDSSDVNYISARHELKAQLQDAIDHLPLEYRTIFVLRDVDGLTNQEVGGMLSISVAAVKSRLHRSRLMLRKRLQRYHTDFRSSEKIFLGAQGKRLEDTSLKAAA